MIRKNQKIFNNLNVLLDACLVFASVLLAYWIRFTFFPSTAHRLALDYYIVAVTGLICVQLFSYKLIGLYDAMRRRRIVYELGRMVLTNTLCFAVMLTVFFMTKSQDFSRGVLLAFFVLENGFLGCKRIATRLALRAMRKYGYNKKHVLIIGSGDIARILEKEISVSRDLGYEVTGYIAATPGEMRSRYLGNFDRVFEVVEKYGLDEVFCALEAEDYAWLPDIIRSCDASGVRFSLMPCYAKYFPVRPQVDSLNGIPLLNLRKLPLDNAANAFIKRAMDIVGSLILIVLTSPLMLIAAIGVKLSSPGPILFKQERVGKDKKLFNMYKFRSMRVNASEKTGWSTNTDPRRTRFGSFIRKYSIDELPQFFNVLMGDMSLIGPRPELPHFVEQFRKDIPLYMVKHQVRPGITGWAQVHGFRGDTSIAERINHDVYYIENWSVLLDVQILLMTVKHVSNDEVLV